jgi:hypothetical protein
MVTRVLRVLPLVAVAWSGAACATGGAGTDPFFGSDGADFDAALEAVDGGGDDAAAPMLCPTDPAHTLAALVALAKPTPCTSSADCSAGQCCFVGTSASACISQ